LASLPRRTLLLRSRLKAGLLAWREESNDPHLDPDELLRLENNHSEKNERK